MRTLIIFLVIAFTMSAQAFQVNTAAPKDAQALGIELGEKIVGLKELQAKGQQLEKKLEDINKAFETARGSLKLDENYPLKIEELTRLKGESGNLQRQLGSAKEEIKTQTQAVATAKAAFDAESKKVEDEAIKTKDVAAMQFINGGKRVSDQLAFDTRLLLYDYEFAKAKGADFERDLNAKLEHSVLGKFVDNQIRKLFGSDGMNFCALQNACATTTPNLVKPTVDKLLSSPPGTKAVWDGGGERGKEKITIVPPSQGETTVPDAAPAKPDPHPKKVAPAVDGART